MNTRLAAGLSIFMILAIGCGGGSGSGGQPASQHITSTSPAKGATNVPVTSSIKLTFDVAADSTTCAFQNVLLTWANGTRNVPGTVACDNTAKTLTFTPTFPLAAGVAHTLTMSKNVITKAAATEDWTLAFTTTPTPILYTSNLDLTDGTKIATPYNIWSILPDGTNNTHLTSYTPDTFSVDFSGWSPDYTKITYAAYNQTTMITDIFIMNADGTGMINLTNLSVPSSISSVIWLQDSSKIFFLSGTQQGVFDIYSVKPDGSEMTKLTNYTGSDGVQFISISPDNSKIVYNLYEQAAGVFNLHSMNLDLTGDVQLSNLSANYQMAYPVISSDSTKVYYSSGNATTPTPNNFAIYSVNMDGTGTQTLFSTPAGGSIDNISISPDGTKLLYDLVTSDADPTKMFSDLYALNISDLSTVQITNNTAGNFVGMLSMWSPDSTKFLYSSGVYNPGAGAYNCFVSNSDGSGKVQLTDLAAGKQCGNTTMLWSPDGLSVIIGEATLLPPPSVIDILIEKADGSATTPLTTSPEWGIATMNAWW